MSSRTIQKQYYIGDMMADFGNKQMFILYGPGGVGKSTVLNIISSLSSNSLSSINSRFIARRSDAAKNYGNSITAEMRAEASNTRLLLVGDLHITANASGNVDRDEHLNVQTVKEFTGGDQNTSGACSVTVLMCAHSLFRYKYMDEYTRADITR
jgi:phage/plasmid-associated DNA primase